MGARKPKVRYRLEIEFPHGGRILDDLTWAMVMAFLKDLTESRCKVDVVRVHRLTEVED